MMVFVAMKLACCFGPGDAPLYDAVEQVIYALWRTMMSCSRLGEVEWPAFAMSCLCSTLPLAKSK